MKSALLRAAHLAEYEHVLALLVRHPVDGLLGLRRLVHALQVLFQDLLVQSYLGRLLKKERKKDYFFLSKCLFEKGD